MPAMLTRGFCSACSKALSTGSKKLIPLRVLCSTVRGLVSRSRARTPAEKSSSAARCAQAQLASNAAERNASTRHRQPSLLAGLLFDGDGNRMTPSHAVKKGTRYRYYVSGSLITKDRTENTAALRIPAAEIEQLVSDRVHRWLLDPGSIDRSTAARLADPSIQHRRIARAAEVSKHWSELPVARKRAVLATLIERNDVRVDRTDTRLLPPRLAALLDGADPSPQGANDAE